MPMHTNKIIGFVYLNVSVQKKNNFSNKQPAFTVAYSEKNKTEQIPINENRLCFGTYHHAKDVST